MPGAAVNLGPFTGGLNNVSEIGTIPDSALSDVINFEFDIDGSQVSRPAIIPEQATGAATGDMAMLGYYARNDGETFLVVSFAGAPGSTQLYQISTQTWQTIWANAASGFVQYDNKVILISATIAGGYWEAGTFTATPTMPFAGGVVFYQERFWAWGVTGSNNATTIWFSNINTISPAQSIYDWVPTSNFITVSRGDGQWITALVADINALLIFRNASTYQLTYPSAPSSGTLRPLSTTIGAENQFSIVSYENYFLIFSAGFLYQLINYKWYPLNTKKVIFQRAALANPLQFNVRVSMFARRAIVWFYGATFVYNIITTTWTRWDSPTTRAGHFLMIPASATSGDMRVALAVTGENDAAKKKLWRIQDGVLSGLVGETMTCSIRTKAYPLNEYGKYKRLMYWQAEVRTATGLSAIAHPVALSPSSVTWDAMAATTWDVLAAGSWDNPLITPVTYLDNITFPALTPQDVVVKLVQGFRFLRSYYELSLVADGTTRTSPARIYAITLLIKIHASVSTKVS